jgi:hypothetical protein
VIEDYLLVGIGAQRFELFEDFGSCHFWHSHDSTDDVVQGITLTRASYRRPVERLIRECAFRAFLAAWLDESRPQNGGGTSAPTAERSATPRDWP